MKAFYFSTTEKKLRYDDNRDIAVGVTHTVSGAPVPCSHGLHASERIVDALLYAPGPVLWLVELIGEAVNSEDGDKMAATERKYLAEFDATEVLRKFARRQALINIEKVKPYCTDDGYSTIVEYLETGNKELRAKAESAAAAAESAAAARSAANKMLTEMIKEATGWDI